MLVALTSTPFDRFVVVTPEVTSVLFTVQLNSSCPNPVPLALQEYELFSSLMIVGLLLIASVRCPAVYINFAYILCIYYILIGRRTHELKSHSKA